MKTTSEQREFLEVWRLRVGLEFTPAMQAEAEQVRLEIAGCQEEERWRPYVVLSHLGQKVSLRYIGRPVPQDSTVGRAQAVETGVARLFQLWKQFAGAPWNASQHATKS